MCFFLVSFGKVRGSPPSIRQFEWWITLLTVRYDQKFVPFCKWNVASNTWQMKIWGDSPVYGLYTKNCLEKSKCAHLVQVRHTDSSGFLYVVFKLFVALQLLWTLMLYTLPCNVLTVLLGDTWLCHMWLFRHKCPGNRRVFDLMLLVDPFGIWNIIRGKFAKFQHFRDKHMQLKTKHSVTPK